MAAISLAVMFAALHSSPALAATGSNTGRVTTLLWYEGHDGLLVRQDGMSDLGGCGRGDYFILPRSHESYKEVYAMLLSAHMADQPLQITVTDCHQGISKIRHVQSAR
jgi:hypothetical protein